MPRPQVLALNQVLSDRTFLPTSASAVETLHGEGYPDRTPAPALARERARADLLDLGKYLETQDSRPKTPDSRLLPHTQDSDRMRT